jgi:hypothetical protein
VTSTAIAHTGPARTLGQATQIEQSRAAEEVRAAVVVAQQCPRNLEFAREEMRRSCREIGLAEVAFYSVPRAGGTVDGPSIHLARELARCFGNVQYGVAELDRNDHEGYSEINAFAWDVQTNVRNSRTFRVRHVGGKGGNQPLKNEQDIYTNNSNAAARRVREAIFAILPKWFRDEAERLCRETLEAAASQEKAEQLIGDFARGAVSLDMLERRVKAPRDRWTAADIASLDVLFRSLRRREVTREEAFPPEGITVDDLDNGGAEDWPEVPQVPAALPGGEDR